MSEVKTLAENVIAQDVSFEDYMEHYAEHHTEWVEGSVIKLSPVTIIHDMLSRFFALLLTFYLNSTKEGKLLAAPFVMRTKPGLPGREQDLHIVLRDRAHIIRDTMTAGPADVVIEIISPDSVERDTEDKFAEYQAGGVREYWLINPIAQEAKFFHLDDAGVYRRISLVDGRFVSRVLSRFVLPTDVFWNYTFLEDDDYIRALVEAMLKEG